MKHETSARCSASRNVKQSSRIAVVHENCLKINLLNEGHFWSSGYFRSGASIMCWCFNVYTDNEHGHKTKAFKSLFDEVGLKQHVNVPIYKFGHVLDLVKTDQPYPNLLLENGPPIEGYVKSVHVPLRFHISWMKPANHLNPSSTGGGKQHTKKPSRPI